MNRDSVLVRNERTSHGAKNVVPFPPRRSTQVLQRTGVQKCSWPLQYRALRSTRPSDPPRIAWSESQYRVRTSSETKLQTQSIPASTNPGQTAKNPLGERVPETARRYRRISPRQTQGAHRRSPQPDGRPPPQPTGLHTARGSRGSIPARAAYLATRPF